MIITISASYGAGGSELGPRIAQQLGLRFIDRAVSVAVAKELGISVRDAEAIEQDTPNRFWNFFAHMSSLSPGMIVPAPVEQGVTDRDVMRGTESELRRVADTGKGVILGHAAAVVLADHADALHIRLDGPPAGRVRSAMQQHGIDEASAKAAQQENDRIRSGYAKHFYGIDSSSAQHYHLVLDTVRIDWDTAERLIIAAATGAP
ncbi:MAG: cytidylate kinase-like family protein [Allobranchiibius sp.]